MQPRATIGRASACGYLVALTLDLRVDQILRPRVRVEQVPRNHPAGGPLHLVEWNRSGVRHLNTAQVQVVNGERRQNGNTRSMIFDVYFLVHYLSQFMTLEAGDLINTGTPPGVGLGMKPPQFLQDGVVVELSVQNLGMQQQTCRKMQAGR